ncbi:hypothetical protein [Leptolyngbya sp. 7M]|uniref:hypothetical protein n=1 Tax=Leptolyngbya sp. 7M TaxID=2812896 RepID=UPI003977B12B
MSNYLADSRSTNCNPDQILITNGAQQALYLVTRLLINSGETIALEEPGYRVAKSERRHQFLVQECLQVSSDTEKITVKDIT